MGMRTRVAAAATITILATFLMGLGPPAGAGLSFLTQVQVTPNLNEGGTAHLTGTLASQCPGGTEVDVSWGDGSPVESFSDQANGAFDFPHVYADDNPSDTPADSYTVTVTAIDPCGGAGQAAARTTVHNVDPAFDDMQAFPHVRGEATRLEATFTDAGTQDSYTVTIDWGDGSQNTVLLLPAIQKIREAHRYMLLGQFKIDVTIQDDDTGTAENSVLVTVPPPTVRIVTSPGEGRPALVKTFDEGAKPIEPTFLAHRSSFTGGVRVAVGDVNGDGYEDIVTAAGAGGGPLVRVWDGSGGGTLIDGFYPYRSSFTGGVFVAAGDLNGDGFAEIVTAPGAGASPLVKVFDGSTGDLRSSFFAYRSSFTGGVRVAVGDWNGDGIPDIITGVGAGGGPLVKVFDGQSLQLLDSFFAFRSSFTGGVFVAAGDVNGDGRSDVLVGADAGGSPLVHVFAAPDPAGGGGGLIMSVMAFKSSFTGGVRVAAGDVNGDGRADIIVAAGPGAGPHVKVFNTSVDGGTLLNFAPYDSSFLGGVYVGFGPIRQAPGP
jgi:hypothetical protein